jgi:hypothetical protein
LTRCRAEPEVQPQTNYLTKDSFRQAYIDMLRKEAEKLFTSLGKMLITTLVALSITFYHMYIINFKGDGEKRGNQLVLVLKNG